jgi:hypothetical protein
MFSRKSTENQESAEKQNQTDLTPNQTWGNQDLQDLSSSEENNPEIVNVVEKISTIISPYFIAIVGLYLYDRNTIIGFLLITLGIISLLKITLKDINELITKVKNFFSLKEE